MEKKNYTTPVLAAPPDQPQPGKSGEENKKPTAEEFARFMMGL